MIIMAHNAEQDISTATQSTTTQKDYCPAAELIWSEEAAEQYRQLMRAAVGRDCLCEGHEVCALLEGAVKSLSALVQESAR